MSVRACPCPCPPSPPARIRILHTCLPPKRAFRPPSDFGTMPLGVKCAQIPTQGPVRPATSLSVNLPSLIPDVEFWRANQHFCSLFSSGKLDFVRCRSERERACQRAAAPLIAHCDKDLVDIGQRRGEERGRFPGDNVKKIRCCPLSC